MANTISIEEIHSRCKDFIALNQGLKFGHCSPIFLFPHTTTRAYIDFIHDELSVPYRRWYSSGRTEGSAVYNKILKRDLLPQDPQVPTEIAKRCNGVYVIADEAKHVMYIGSRESRTDHVIVRFLDHLVPERSPEYPYGQPSNNDKFIWNHLRDLNRKDPNARLHCFICYDLNFDARALEAYLLSFKNAHGGGRSRH